MTELSADRARELLSYDPATGVIVWRVNRGGTARTNEPAGAIDRQGYAHIKIDGRDYFAHRIAWLLTTGAWPLAQIDHINGLKADNRLSNLREASQAENMRNRPMYRNNETGFKGVTFNKRDGRWQARIKRDGKLIHLGQFKSPEDASAAYAEEAAKLHGEFVHSGLEAK